MYASIRHVHAPEVGLCCRPYRASRVCEAYIGNPIQEERQPAQGLFPAQASLIHAENGVMASVVVVAVLMAMIAAIVFVEQGQRRIPVQFAKRVVGRRMYGGQNTYIPLKVNQSGVIPIIFASSVLYLPVLVAAALPWDGFRGWIDNNLAQPDNVFYFTITGGGETP